MYFLKVKNLHSVIDLILVMFTNVAQRLFFSEADRQPVKSSQLFMERKIKR